MNTKKIMHFLKGIAANNNKQWFQEHKAEYDEVKADFENGGSLYHNHATQVPQV